YHHSSIKSRNGIVRVEGAPEAVQETPRPFARQFAERGAAIEAPFAGGAGSVAAFEKLTFAVLRPIEQAGRNPLAADGVPEARQSVTKTEATLSEYLLEKANRRFGFPKRIDPSTAQALSSVAELLWTDNLGPVVRDGKPHQVPE